MPDKKLNLVLCWHMHQPDYRHYDTGAYILPWTYLHALKDYADMAFHVESHPQIHCVFNFVPVLLDQLEDYAAQMASGQVNDPLLSLLAEPDLGQASPAQRQLILDSCFRNHHETMILPFPPYRRLLDLYRLVCEDPGAESYLSAQYLADLLVWYHLSWTGESIRRSSPEVAELMARGAGFTLADRQRLFQLIGDVIRGLIPRYKKLLAEGRIEISTTPHYHPIVPLLIDFRAARESQPDIDLPQAPGYPGGLKRAAFHLESALSRHSGCFGQAAAGIWPAEGGISQASLDLFEQHGVHWTASGEGVLVNSLRAAYGDQPLPDRLAYLYRPYRFDTRQGSIRCFFRDERLSDLIGFEYSRWFGRDAVQHFMHALEEIYHHTPEGENPVVTVILDGENAWEYYPYNGYYFLQELYEALAQHPFIHTATFSECLAEQQTDGEQVMPSGHLARVVAGSWVYGNFATWIGSRDKNRAWDLLAAAKQSYDHVMASGRLPAEAQAAASRQLADCEGSDWFWWFGDYNPQQSVESFDRLYRENLANLYRLLQLPAPADLSQPISHGGGEAESGGTMRRAV